jgi:hypothetical protein
MAAMSSVCEKLAAEIGKKAHFVIGITAQPQQRR